MTPACERCGQAHPRCKGHNRAGGPCGMRPAPNQEVCSKHGAKSPQAIAAAKTRELEARARVALRKAWAAGEERPTVDPLGDLARIAGEAVAFKDYLRGEVEQLDQLTQQWSDRAVTMMTADGMREFAVVKEDMRAIVLAYERAIERCAKILADIVKLDLAGRMLELNTAKAALIVEAVRNGLADVDMSAEVRRAAQAAIGEHLASITQRNPEPKELAG